MRAPLRLFKVLMVPPIVNSREYSRVWQGMRFLRSIPMLGNNGERKHIFDSLLHGGFGKMIPKYCAYRLEQSRVKLFFIASAWVL